MPFAWLLEVAMNISSDLPYFASSPHWAPPIRPEYPAWTVWRLDPWHLPVQSFECNLREWHWWIGTRVLWMKCLWHRENYSGRLQMTSCCIVVHLGLVVFDGDSDTAYSGICNMDKIPPKLPRKNKLMTVYLNSSKRLEFF